MSAPPMPPGKMPPRPPGMKIAPPMPPGFKASAGNKAPPMPPGMHRPPPRPSPSAPVSASVPPPAPLADGQPRYLAPPGYAPQIPPPPSKPPAAPVASSESAQHPRYLMPPTAAGVPTMSAEAMRPPPQLPPPSGDYGYDRRDSRNQHYAGGRGRGMDGRRSSRNDRGGDYREDYDRLDNRNYDRLDNRNYDRNYDRRNERGGERGYGRGRGRGRDHDGGTPPRSESRRPSAMREATNTVWVGSYSPTFHSRSALCRAFWPFGRVMQISVHEEKGFAFVHMRRTEEAQTAVRALIASSELGTAVFNFSKHYDFTPEEMALPYDANVVVEPPDEEMPEFAPSPGGRRPRDDDTDPREHRDFEDPVAGLPPPRRQRGEKEGKEPSAVLWIGNLVPFISNAKLEEAFEVFGPIVNLSRLTRANIAFITFETVEQCTMALETMRGRPLEGVVLSMNYGHQASPREDGGLEGGAGGGTRSGSSVRLTPEGIPAYEVPTNVIYIGSLPGDADAQDVENLFEPYDGFIFSKFVDGMGVGFGHFDTIENAHLARVGLLQATLKGSPIVVNFGKNNHSFTMTDRRRLNEMGPSPIGSGAGLGFNGAGGTLDPVTGALITGGGTGFGGGAGARVLPARGANAGGTDAGNTNVYAKVRPAPELTMDNRLQSLLGSPYNGCGTEGLELGPSQLQGLCQLVDGCVAESSYETLRDALAIHCPLRAVHVFSAVAKRMKEFADDPHKRLLVLYAVTHVLLSVKTEYTPFSASALNAYLMVLLVASEGQTSSGMDRLTTIIESLQQHYFVETRSNAGKDYEEDFRTQLEDIANRAKAEQDLRSIAKRRRRRD